MTVVRTNRSAPQAAIIPVLVYPDVREAVAWLHGAFGFRERLQIGEGHRSQLTYGDGWIIVAEEHRDRRGPEAGKVSHQVMVRVEDARAHCEQARQHGAYILMEPTDFMYGERQYEAEDLAGHHWVFTQTIEDIDPKEWDGIPKD